MPEEEPNETIHDTCNSKNLCELIKKSAFYSGDNNLNKIESEILNRIPLNKIDFTNRFKNYLISFPEINNLEDLLNYDYKKFLKKCNIGLNSIFDDRNIILETIKSKDFHDEQIDDFLIINNFETNKSEEEQQADTSFLKRFNIKLDQINIEVLNMPLSFLNLPIRIKNFIDSDPNLFNIRDFLFKDNSFFYNRINFGKKSFETLQNKVLEAINQNNTHNYYILENKSNYIDKKIANKIKSLCKAQRETDIILQRLSYKYKKNQSLKDLGKKYDLTRERIRQIVMKNVTSYKFKKTVFEELKIIFDNYGYIINKKRLLTFMINNNKWSKKNGLFYINLINLLKSEIHCDNDFILHIDLLKNKKNLKIIHENIMDAIENKKEGTKISNINNILLKKQFESEIDLKKLLIIDTFEYLCFKNKMYFIRGDIIFNKMMHVIYFGTILKDIIFWCLKYFSEPIHFTQLAQFIRETNEHFKNVTDETVHSTLINSNYCHYADRGTYVLKELNIPKHKTAKDAIINLIKTFGEITERDIIEKLKNEYSSSNIKLALKNNEKIFIKIGNDLYELRRPLNE